MRSTIHLIAAIILSAALIGWWNAGAHRGWTKTSVQVWKDDEITGISYPETVKRFVPGVDFLAGAAVLAGLISCSALLVRRRKLRS